VGAGFEGAEQTAAEVDSDVEAIDNGDGDVDGVKAGEEEVVVAEGTRRFCSCLCL
jgi:hypothetical protein